jgi:hypothetical protein
MSLIDFFTYVVSDFRISFNLAFILLASAIFFFAVVAGLAIMSSHVHVGALKPFTGGGLTVGLTAAGTMLVAAVRLLVKRGRRRDHSDQGHDDTSDGHG